MEFFSEHRKKKSQNCSTPWLHLPYMIFLLDSMTGFVNEIYLQHLFNLYIDIDAFKLLMTTKQFQYNKKLHQVFYSDQLTNFNYDIKLMT